MAHEISAADVRVVLLVILNFTNRLQSVYFHLFNRKPLVSVFAFQVTYLEEKFNLGQATGQKQNPINVI